ncbi:MAG: class I SAM-dependent methyltransferase [Anaerolineales bacterium]
MSTNRTNGYDLTHYTAELYDRQITATDDVELLRKLIGDRGPLRILEPFCGTGRVLIPLARDGHTLVGLDQAVSMLALARSKVQELPSEAQERISLREVDVTGGPWPTGFDLVILGGNCFYELATPEEQERIVAYAARSLRPGGHVYVDNDHMEGELAESWREPGTRPGGLFGACADGTQVESRMETLGYDAPRRLVKFRRSIRIIAPAGEVTEHEYLQQKHPVSTGEVRGWLKQHGFTVEALYGDREGTPYTADSPRAIFWARKAPAAGT